MTKLLFHIIIVSFILNIHTTFAQSNLDTISDVGSSRRNIGLFFPEEMYIVEGNRLEIFKHSIIKAINPENYFLNAKVIKGTPKGKFYDRVFIYDCKPGDGEMTIEFTLTHQDGLVLDKRSTVIKPVKKSADPKSKINVLLIGDSFTSTKTYPNELVRRIIGSGGHPVGDNLKNVNFIGNSPNDDNTPREGYGGKSWTFFLSESSPFYNKKTKKIDFKYYAKKNNYEGIDAVVIMLGTNSISNNETISSFLNKLIEYNPNIRGIITGKILATPLGGGGSVGISHRQTFYGSFHNTFLYNQRMENLINDSFSSNFKYIDILSSFDILHNMQFSYIAPNFRNQEVKIKQGSNNVHPAKSGYLQISDMIYNGFHYFILKK